MADERLVSEIRRRLLRNESKPNITQALSIEGYGSDEIEEAFRNLPLHVQSSETSETPPSHAPDVINNSLISHGVPAKILLVGITLAASVSGIAVYKVSKSSVSPVVPAAPSADATLSAAEGHNDDPSIRALHQANAGAHTVSACADGITAQDEKDGNRLASLKRDMAALASSANQTGPTADSGEKRLEQELKDSLKIDDIQTRYDALAAGMTRRQVESEPAENIADAYRAYCADGVAAGAPDSRSAQGLLAFNEKLSKGTFSNLVCSLRHKEYGDAEASRAMYSMGFKLFQAQKIDSALTFYACGAEKHYDEMSMYRIAQMYAYGTDAFKKLYPDATIRSEIKSNPKEAYYWLSVLTHTEGVQQTGILDSSTQIGWNIVGLLDSLQQGPSLSDDDLASAERDAIAFVGKAYPQVRNDRLSVYAHSMRAMIQGLQNAAAPAQTSRQGNGTQ